MGLGNWMSRLFGGPPAAVPALAPPPEPPPSALDERRAKALIDAWVKGATFGERTMSSLSLPIHGYGLNVTWADNRAEQVRHFKHFVYVAVRKICEFVASMDVRVGLATEDQSPNTRRRGARRWRRKGRLPEGAELEPAPDDHPLVCLLRDPNGPEVRFRLWYELFLFLELTGNGYLWCPPNAYGQPAEMWTIPSHWVRHRAGEDGIITHYDLYPLLGQGSVGVVTLPADEVIHVPWPSPISKVDGYSPLTAIARVIDSLESIELSRWAQFKNGAFPAYAMELDQSLLEPSPEDISRIEQKFLSKFQGETKYGKPIVLSPGIKLVPLNITPTEMAYTQSYEQLRDTILAAFGVPKAMVAPEGMTYGSVAALLHTFFAFTIRPKLIYLSQILTEKIAKRFDPRLRVWWPDPSPTDPDAQRSERQSMFQAGVITANEWRQEAGYEPYPHGGDNPLVQGQEKPWVKKVPPEQQGGGGPPGGGMGGMPGMGGKSTEPAGVAESAAPAAAPDAHPIARLPYPQAPALPEGPWPSKDVPRLPEGPWPQKDVPALPAGVWPKGATGKKKQGNRPLGKPFRLPSGSKKKFGVYVKNDKGNVVLVKFGDPNMEIRRDDPEARKNFRSRHGCSDPGPRWKPRYWSCRMWSKRNVRDLAKGLTQESLEVLYPWLKGCEVVEDDCGCQDCDAGFGLKTVEKGWDESRVHRDDRGRFGSGAGPAEIATPDPDPAPVEFSARAEAAARLGQWLDGAVEGGLPPERAEHYRATALTVLGKMTDTAVGKFLESAGGAVFVGALPELAAHYLQETGNPVKEGDTIGAFYAWDPDPRRKHLPGTLYLDGGEGYNVDAEGIYAHEFAHAVDHGRRYSGQSDWQDAWSAEVRHYSYPLSRYAAKNSWEGFAEFARLCVADPDAARKFRRCWRFFERNGLAPGAGVAKSAAWWVEKRMDSRPGWTWNEQTRRWKKDKEEPKKEEKPAAKKEPKEEKEPAKGKPKKGDLAEAAKMVDAVARGEGDAAALGEVLASLTVKDLDALKKRHGFAASGLKAAKVGAIVAAAVEAGRKARPAPEPEKPAQEPPPAPERPAEKPAASTKFALDPALSPAGKKAMQKIAEGIRASRRLSPEDRVRYAEAAQRVFVNMPDAAIDRFVAGSPGGTHFYPSMDDVGLGSVARLEKIGEQSLADFSKRMIQVARDRNSVYMAGSYIYAKKDGSVHVDGGFAGPEGEKRRREGRSVDPHEIYAHEFAHAVDGIGFPLSGSDEWREAWVAEISAESLSRYATGSASEGFAEFGRLVYGGSHNLADVKARFPKCWAFLESHGLVKPAGGKTKGLKGSRGGQGPMLPEVFTHRVEIGKHGHFDGIRAVGGDGRPPSPKEVAAAAVERAAEGPFGDDGTLTEKARGEVDDILALLGKGTDEQESR